MPINAAVQNLLEELNVRSRRGSSTYSVTTTALGAMRYLDKQTASAMSTGFLSLAPEIRSCPTHVSRCSTGGTRHSYSASMFRGWVG